MNKVKLKETGVPHDPTTNLRNRKFIAKVLGFSLLEGDQKALRQRIREYHLEAMAEKK